MKLNNKNLIQWFLNQKRIFPWRESLTPYHIWVSEVMLQQTRASVVVPYFLKWIKAFPTLKTLSQASESEVVKLWEGLGYYSRARNLLAGAKEIMNSFNGKLPKDPKDLLSIKGIGPYTVGAICSLAYGIPLPAVDGNVLRVLSRHFLIEEEITKISTRKQIENLIQPHIPPSNPGPFNEALIELGATLCTPKNPNCNVCPLATTCLAKKEGLVHQLPFKKKREKMIPLYRSVAIIQYKDQFLIQKGKKGKVMEGLYEFPYFERDQPGYFEEETLKDLGVDFSTSFTTLPKITHTFTKYKASLFPVHIRMSYTFKKFGFQWVSHEELHELPFSSGHRRILASLLASRTACT